MISSFGGLVANIIAGMIIKQPTLHDWRKLYIIFFFVYFFGGLVFLVFGSATPEKWATFRAREPSDAPSPEETVPMKTEVDEHLYANA